MGVQQLQLGIGDREETLFIRSVTGGLAFGFMEGCEGALSSGEAEELRAALREILNALTPDGAIARWAWHIGGTFDSSVYLRIADRLGVKDTRSPGASLWMLFDSEGGSSERTELDIDFDSCKRFLEALESFS